MGHHGSNGLRGARDRHFSRRHTGAARWGALGILVPPGQPDAIRSAVEDLLAMRSGGIGSEPRLVSGASVITTLDYRRDG